MLVPSMGSTVSSNEGDRQWRSPMSDGHRRLARRLVSGLVLVLVVGLLGGAAEADVGDVLWTVDIPVAAQCAGNSGSAVAVVPGGKLNFPKFQSLLVTSCVVGGQAKLFFLDSSTNPATLVSTLDTSVTPTAGWESLALRSDKVDLIGCGMVGARRRSTRSTSTRSPPTPPLTGRPRCSSPDPPGRLAKGSHGTAPVTRRPSIRAPREHHQRNVLHLSEAGASIAGSVLRAAQVL